jgi:hypothetical protein
MRRLLTRPRSRTGKPLLAALLASTALASSSCVLKKPPDAAAIKEEALPAMTLPGQWTAAGGGAGTVADNWLVTLRTTN